MDEILSVTPIARDAAHNEDENEACLHAQTLVYAFNITMAIKAAIQLRLLDMLSKADGRALTAEELVAQAQEGTDNKAEVAVLVDRILRHHIAAAVAGGGRQTPFERAHGAPIFDYMGVSPRLSTLFDQAMAQQSMLVVNKLLEHCSRVFDGVGVLIDLGGGTGATIAMITERYKHIRVINFDLPHVISEAPPFQGVEHVAGSWFDSLPTGDAFFLKDDEDCIKILKNCRRALTDNGKVIVVQSVLPATPEATPAARDSYTMDMIMLVNFKGGKERTEHEYTELARAAGFAGALRSTYIFCNIYALEFTK
ncbi:hypothetical protein PR202_gb04893 [Eleusine coracana subsp. coracana]|uniref:Uncharacterized protein n=1 Tax=Eleusine coracana subsp. coracana TaxID=191504 RepID=A0AAV5E586_ELECO|nr:hypothetical protein PR202_gb04893 [Eleusine coracana subsp. coracana]